MDQWNEELKTLFGRYRELLPDPEATAGFMPNLWRAIDARRNVALRIRRVTQFIVAGAACACLAMIASQSVRRPGLPERHATYTDVLAASHRSESLAALGIVRESAEPGK